MNNFQSFIKNVRNSKKYKKKEILDSAINLPYNNLTYIKLNVFDYINRLFILLITILIIIKIVINTNNSINNLTLKKSYTNTVYTPINNDIDSFQKNNFSNSLINIENNKIINNMDNDINPIKVKNELTEGTDILFL